MKRLVLVATFLGAASPLAAQDASAIDFEEALARYVEETMTVMPAVPGIHVTVTSRDSIAFSRGFGWADEEAGARMLPDTRMYIASNTKSFTGLAAALLAARGVLDLDASVVEYVGAGRFSVTLHPESVTVRDLLTHTSGMVNDPLVFRTAYSSASWSRCGSSRRSLSTTSSVACDSEPPFAWRADRAQVSPGVVRGGCPFYP